MSEQEQAVASSTTESQVVQSSEKNGLSSSSTSSSGENATEPKSSSTTSEKKGMTYQELMNGTDDDDWVPNVPKELPEWCSKDHPLLSNSVDMNNPITEALAHMKYEGTPDEIATNFKNQGNSLLKETKTPEKYYKDVIQYYSEGLEQPITDMRLKVDLLNNRSHVLSLMGNYGRAIEDAKAALKIDKKNTKSMFRIAKAAMALKKHKTVIKYAEKALKIEKTHPLFEDMIKKAEEELKKEQEKKAKELEKKKQQQQIPQQIKDFLILRKGISVGNYTELETEHINTYTNKASTGGIQVDNATGEVFFSVIFVYDEFSQTDFVSEFSEHQTLKDQLDLMFPPNGPTFPYGCEKDYVLSNLCVFFLDPTSLKEANSRYIEIKNLNTSLIKILTRKDYLLPSSLMPVLHIVRKNHALELNIK
ncbi:hypothetical protein C9374_006029 [Naegleria lovaniensis]|uniref:Cns1/TTC4 wheel domain-containing protein n=1 Tax=Naegleria lovaniensis TaxID=51637 RepID=A0AA88GPF6_NAELO|nr:uncharacterized protein C9374_006029 [Naegleria lovaniensis]KAG2381645.1 hypothetical protein C9374_006029 [Naegleria lovaniensis]